MSGRATNAVAPPLSSSYSARYLGTLNQPDTAPDLELDENDVVWSSSPSSLSSDDEEPDSPSATDADADATVAGGGGGSEPQVIPTSIRRPNSSARRSGLSILLAEDEPRSPGSAGLVVRYGGVSSAPVRVPEWPGRRERSREVDKEEEEGMVPPHVMVARLHVMRSSVTEGIGRTLKGWDLYRVRTASLLMTGYIQCVQGMYCIYRKNYD